MDLDCDGARQAMEVSCSFAAAHKLLYSYCIIYSIAIYVQYTKLDCYPHTLHNVYGLPLIYVHSCVIN